jgi:hypothetical protein
MDPSATEILQALLDNLNGLLVAHPEPTLWRESAVHAQGWLELSVKYALTPDMPSGILQIPPRDFDLPGDPA